MKESEIDPKILDQIKKLGEKYEAMGQDISSYLDGLLHADYLTYWDYIHLETLMSLQTPKTGYKDEMIFIVYHQHTELFFKLILWELDQIVQKDDLTDEFFIARVKRINNYFEILENSFNVMVDGMEPEQFMQFRMSLLPASGFQSAQYRLIEINSTDLYYLVNPNNRSDFDEHDILEQVIEKIYWRSGATELATGIKTLTLKQFEDKYMDTFIERAKFVSNKNLRQLYLRNFITSDSHEEIKDVLRKYDLLANVNWPLAHYKSAVKYLQKDPVDIAATGGTNWQKYLPPRFQRIMFFPELWTQEEQDNWGKSWVVKALSSK